MQQQAARRSILIQCTKHVIAGNSFISTPKIIFGYLLFGLFNFSLNSSVFIFYPTRDPIPITKSNTNPCTDAFLISVRQQEN